MKTQLFALCVLLLISSCEEGYVYDSRRAVSGKAFLQDTELNGDIPVPAKGVDIILRDTDSKTADYLQKTTTTADGSFEFSYIPKTEKTLYIRAETSQNSADYAGEKAIQSSKSLQEVTLELIPTYTNALKVTVLTAAGEPWSGINTYLYQNAALVTHVVSTSQVPASGYSTSQKTSQKGIVIYKDLKVGDKYQVVVANKLDDKKVLSGNSASVPIKQGATPESTTITID